MPSHGACRLALPCASNSPSDGEPGGRPKPRKSSEVRVVIEPLRMNGRKVIVATVAFGRTWRTMICRIGDAERARRADVIEIARAQKLGAHHVDQAGPRKQQHQSQQPPEIRLDQARQDDQQVEHRQARPDLDEALEAEIDEAAEIALHRAGGDPDHRGEQRSAPGRTAPRCESRRSAAPARRGPGRRCRASRRATARAGIRPRRVGDRVVAERDQRPDDPALVRRSACLTAGSR